VAGARGRTHEGSGIGLALVQELARLHDGSVSVESDYGKGSTFRVFIPLGHSHLPYKQVGQARAQVSSASGVTAFVEEALNWLPGGRAEVDEVIKDIPVPEQPKGQEVARARILLADDNADMREYVGRLLRARYDVEAVADGEAALAAIERREPDLVLSDVMMPRLDGFGLLARLRADPRRKTLPVILLSARAGEEARIQGLEATADDYLIKPFSARELLARVATHLELSRVREQAARSVADSEARFRAVFEQAATGVCLVRPEDGRFILVNQALCTMLGYTEAELKEKNWQQIIHRDDLNADVAFAWQALANELPSISRELRWMRKDGTPAWVRLFGSCIRGRDGSVSYGVGVVADISDRIRAEGALIESEARFRTLAEQRKLLISELNHRVKNMLATVQVIAAQSLSSVPKHALEAFEARLIALSQAHGILTRESWEAADLSEIMTRTLGAHAGPERVRIEGPRIRLSPKGVLVLTLGLHELATNAVKYGALSNETGRVAVNWTVDGPKPGSLFLRWEETGGPAVKKSGRKGFGSQLIERSLARDLDGEARIDYRPEGVVCTITCSLGSVGEARTSLSCLQAEDGERVGRGDP
jgi:PAS domain S-box-containing protein